MVFAIDTMTTIIICALGIECFFLFQFLQNMMTIYFEMAFSFITINQKRFHNCALNLRKLPVEYFHDSLCNAKNSNYHWRTKLKSGSLIDQSFSLY